MDLSIGCGRGMIPVTVCGFLFIELIVVSYCDFKSRHILNIWSVLNILLYCVFLIIFSDIYTPTISALVIPSMWIFVGFFLYKWNIMGAGDSKYLCTFFLLIPQAIQMEMLESLAYGTLLTGLPLLVFNVCKNIKSIILFLRTKDYLSLKGYFGKKITYIPVIFISYILFIIKIYKVVRI